MNNEIVIDEKYAPLFDENNDCRYFIITGGRGSGKSFGVSTFLTNSICANEHRKILFTRYTMTAAGISIIPEFQEKINLLGMDNIFESNTKNATVTNTQTDNSILFRGIKTSSGNQTASLKSIQGITDFVLDEAEELDSEETFDTIDLSVRDIRSKNRIIILLNPCHTDFWIYKRFFQDKDIGFAFNGIRDNVCYIHTTYLDNIDNLTDSYIQIAKNMKANNYAKYQHLFLGKWTSDIEGALWKMTTMIDPYRVKELPDLRRIIISVDPAVTSTGYQDECGIVVLGEDFSNDFYVIDDLSGLYTPSEWAKVSVGAFKKYEADNIIAETNQGGDLVVMAMKNIDKNIPVKTVRATRGKILRAEPVAGLYEEGRVHHLKRFYELETEMTTFTGCDNKKELSPNRLDALVHGIVELSGTNNIVEKRHVTGMY